MKIKVQHLTRITFEIKGERKEYLINGSQTTDYIFEKKMLDFCPIPYPKGIDPLIIKWKKGGMQGGLEDKTEENVCYFKM